MLFYADSRKTQDGILIADFTRWIAVPPINLVISSNPDYIELERGKQTNIEVMINSTQGYEPTVNLYTTNKSKDISFDFLYDKLRIPSHGITSTSMNIETSENATLGPRTLFIFANSSFPPEEIIKPKVKSFAYHTSIPTENIITQSTISIKIKEPPDWLTTIGQNWEKVGGFSQFLYGIIAGITPWIYQMLQQRKKRRNIKKST